MDVLLPGKGWRALTIGAALHDVTRELGAPSHTKRFDDFIAVDWRPLGVKAYLNLDETVRSMEAVFREIYVEGFTPFAGTTDRGIGADSTIEQIEAAYGPAPERRGNKSNILVYQGILFSFQEGALYDITVDPENTPSEQTPLPEPHPYNELGQRALELIEDLERRVAALGRDDVQVVLTPTEPEWLDNVERRFGHRLPPSYRQLVLTRGTLHVEVEGQKTAWMIPIAQLGGPSPTWWAGEGEDEEVDEAVARCLYFAYEHDDAVENFWTFDPNTVDARGEMGVGCYYHDERFKGGGGRSFDEYLEDSIAKLFKYYLS